MKSSIQSQGFLWLTLSFTITFVSKAQATEYYVDQNHPSANDQNTGTINSPWKTITKANNALTAGDIVYIKAGTYSSYIAPVKSGTSTSRITYKNYGSDLVTISGAPYAIYLSGKSYITVEGINAKNDRSFVYIINGSHHNIIAYSNFDQSSDLNQWDVSLMNGGSQYNWIHHSRFSKGGECSTAASDNGQVFDIGTEGSSTDLTRYNLIEDSAFFHGGHHLVGLFGSYNTIRNNYFHNEAWSRDRGNRTLYMNGTGAGTGYNVIEGNRFGYAAKPCDGDTVGTVTVTTPYNLIRYNKIYHGNAYGIGLYSYSGYSQGSYNKFYNNTFFNNGWNIASGYKGGMEDSAITIFSASPNPTGNVFKNNLYFSHNTMYAGLTSGQTFMTEFNGDVKGDPKFVNASTTPPTDKNDATVPNLDLQSGSPAIDQGGALTTVAVADTGSGTTLAVNDASYFQDGTRAPVGTVQADWIAVGTTGNVVQIASISGNTITLASSITRKDNDPVWLYKKSDGAQVLFGSAPDAGAAEFLLANSPLMAPANLRIIP
jgi:hypothetical protein